MKKNYFWFLFVYKAIEMFRNYKDTTYPNEETFIPI